MVVLLFVVVPDCCWCLTLAAPAQNIRALAEGEHQAHYRALCLFAYGTYAEYAANPSLFPELTSQQVTKLKQLTVVDVAARSMTKRVSYHELQSALRMERTQLRDLEDLIISAM